MDIQQYISSGILENYALGLVSETERQEVERMMMQYPEIKNALLEIEDTLKGFAMTQAMDMPDGLLEKSLSKLDRLPKEMPLQEAKTPISKPVKWKQWGLATLLGVSLCSLAVSLYSRLKLKEEYLQTIDKLTILEQDCDEKDSKILFLERQSQILQDTANQTIYMRGVPTKDPNAIAAVHYNTKTKKTYLDIRSLPEPPTNKQYQLWAIVDGNPVDMGVFDLLPTQDAAFIEVPFVGEAQAFAVTLEDYGGKPSPNLDELYVIGNT